MKMNMTVAYTWVNVANIQLYPRDRRGQGEAKKALRPNLAKAAESGVGLQGQIWAQLQVSRLVLKLLQ